MVAVATITWALLTCLSAFIYCCTYGRLFKAAVDSDSELDSQSEQLDLELQSMLPKD
ncbi:uncharacterized protein LOC108596005 [Drosophila busckii]|uniref:uncharacterized protein LOC108596005 n=1 Tax=Drosophila busckii TaxID=30019 RepID=UPI00083ED526|nr:uncharacterized protein LOC108596005 [Drosophila busckii]